MEAQLPRDVLPYMFVLGVKPGAELRGVSASSSVELLACIASVNSGTAGVLSHAAVTTGASAGTLLAVRTRTDVSTIGLSSSDVAAAVVNGSANLARFVHFRSATTLFFDGSLAFFKQLTVVCRGAGTGFCSWHPVVVKLASACRGGGTGLSFS